MTATAGEHTFLFADLAGFTALTEVHGDEQAADLAGVFFAAVRRLLPEYGAEEIKALGDALMIRAGDAACAVSLGMRVVQDLAVRHAFPHVRVGMHTGPAVERDGDWFGAAVNLAARVAALAAAGEVLTTAATRTAVNGRLPDADFRARGPRVLKNVGAPVEIFAMVATSGARAAGLPVDPVCRMAVDPAQSLHRVSHRGTENHFCSEACAHAFASDPFRYQPPGEGSGEPARATT